MIKSLDVSILLILSLMGCSAASILDAIFCSILLFSLHSNSSNSRLSWIVFDSWDVGEGFGVDGLSWDKGGVVSSGLAIFMGVFFKGFLFGLSLGLPLDLCLRFLFFAVLVFLLLITSISESHVVSSAIGSCWVHLDLVQLGQFGNKVFILG